MSKRHAESDTEQKYKSKSEEIVYGIAGLKKNIKRVFKNVLVLMEMHTSVRIRLRVRSIVHLEWCEESCESLRFFLVLI